MRISFQQMMLVRMETLGLTKSEFAEKMSPWAGKSTVYGWLRGASEPKMVSDLLALFRVLWVPPKETHEWLSALQLSELSAEAKTRPRARVKKEQ